MNNLSNVKYVNQFWINVLDAWTEFNQKLSHVAVSDIISQPLWHNHLIKFEVIKQWQHKGLCFLADLLHNDGSIVSMEDLKVIYGIMGTLIDYYRLVKIIPASWLNKIVGSHIEFGPRIMPVIKILCSTKKECKPYCDMLMTIEKTIVLNCEHKWHRDLQILEFDLDWSNIYSRPFAVTTDTDLRYFQYKILHRILTTNVFLELRCIICAPFAITKKKLYCMYLLRAGM
jgi:hypothetical protein